MDRVEKHINYLKVLESCNKPLRRSIIENGPKELVKTICECVLNLLKGNVEIENNIKARLKKKRSILKQLSDKKTPLKKKRVLLVQKGSGILPLLLPAVFQALTSIIN